MCNSQYALPRAKQIQMLKSETLSVRSSTSTRTCVRQLVRATRSILAAHPLPIKRVVAATTASSVAAEESLIALHICRCIPSLLRERRSRYMPYESVRPHAALTRSAGGSPSTILLATYLNLNVFD